MYHAEAHDPNGEYRRTVRFLKLSSHHRGISKIGSKRTEGAIEVVEFAKADKL